MGGKAMLSQVKTARTDNNVIKVREYELNPPTVYESQLFPGGDVFDLAKGSVLDLCESTMLCFSGPRGGGKTASLAYAGMKALAGGQRVWLNFPLEFYLIRDRTGDGKSREHLSAEMLDLKAFLAMKS